MSLYLVTGGAGYIGSHLVEYLVAQGHSIRVLDNLVSGKVSRIPAAVEFVEGDVCDRATVLRVLEGVEGIFHLAALPRVAFSIEHPVEVYEANTAGTWTLLEAARKKGVQRIVFSSTSAIYGNAEILPTDELSPVNPLNPYALSKNLSEQILKQYADLYNVETVCLRYFNVYGPRMEENAAYATVVAAFLGCRRQREPLTIHGTGEQKRDFVHVTDVARANLLAMTNGSVGRGEVINIGSGESVSVLEIAELMRGSEPLRYESARLGDARYTLANIGKAERLLGWKPEILFREGLKRVLASESL